MARNRALKVALVALVGLLLLGGLLICDYGYRVWGPVGPFVAVALLPKLFATPEWVVLIAADIPKDGRVEVLHRWRLAYNRYEYIWRWRKSDGETLDYLIAYTGNSLTSHPELRATHDYRGVWLVARDEIQAEKSQGAWAPGTAKEGGFVRAGILAVLDTRSGKFIAWNHYVIRDPSLPFDRQIGNPCESAPYPDWATGDGGVLLAERKLD